MLSESARARKGSEICFKMLQSKKNKQGQNTQVVTEQRLLEHFKKQKPQTSFPCKGNDGKRRESFSLVDTGLLFWDFSCTQI